MKLSSKKAKLLGAVSVAGLIFGTPAALAALTQSTASTSASEVSNSASGNLAETGTSTAVIPGTAPINNIVEAGSANPGGLTMPGTSPSPSNSDPLNLDNPLGSAGSEVDESGDDSAIESDEANQGDEATLTQDDTEISNEVSSAADQGQNGNDSETSGDSSNQDSGQNN